MQKIGQDPAGIARFIPRIEHGHAAVRGQTFKTAPRAGAKNQDIHPVGKGDFLRSFQTVAPALDGSDATGCAAETAHGRLEQGKGRLVNRFKNKSRRLAGKTARRL